MAGITLAQAQAMLDAAMATLVTAQQGLSAQWSTSTGGRRIERVSVPDAQAQVKYWNGEVQRLSRGNHLATYSAVPL